MATQQRGKIRSWKDDKGFGFITPDNGGDDVFFHITNLASRGKRPQEQIPVFYTLSYDDQHRPRALNVYLVNESILPVLASITVAGLFFLLLAGATLVLRLSPWLFLLYVVMSGITFFVYGVDKNSAAQGKRRVPEANLHLLELLGGWPGALVAQWYLYHKNRKSFYQTRYWVVVLLNLCLLVLTIVIGKELLHILAL